MSKFKNNNFKIGNGIKEKGNRVNRNFKNGCSKNMSILSKARRRSNIRRVNYFTNQFDKTDFTMVKKAKPLLARYVTGNKI